MGKRDEVIPVDLAPAAHRGQSFFQRGRELFVAPFIKRLGGKPFADRLELRDQLVDDSMLQDPQPTRAGTQGEVISLLVVRGGGR